MDRTAQPAPVRNAFAMAADLLTLTKPRVTAFVVLSSGAGMVLAEAKLPRLTALSVLLSIALVVGSANALNCYLERDSDGLMSRTRLRPLPQKRLTPWLALAFGLLLAAVSLPWLYLYANALTAFLGLFALVTYVAIYTPLKRKSPLALYIGAIPGALPPLMGFAAVDGRLGGVGIAIFLVLLLWQVPHFLAIAIFREQEYAAAGLRTLPVVYGAAVARAQLLVATALLVPLSLLLVWLGAAGVVYAACALGASVGWLSLGLFTRHRLPAVRWARLMFVASLLYVPVLVGGLVVDRLA